jgi:hypothetical protein
MVLGTILGKFVYEGLVKARVDIVFMEEGTDLGSVI